MEGLKTSSGGAIDRLLEAPRGLCKAPRGPNTRFEPLRDLNQALRDLNQALRGLRQAVRGLRWA